ncbi:MAG: ATP synthase F1 subunit gamma [Bacteroidetes bacterium]|nr:ATP synthase F1 subunit gamma [Bacteroidota bacterium]
MPSLKEVRTRIASTISTQQITSAMKMVSAAKLKRAQDAILQLRPYAAKLKSILENVTSSSGGASGGVFAKERSVKNVLLVAITSNRGLCGAFNSNVIKTANRLIREEYKGTKVSVISIGRKANDYFKKTEYGIVGSDLPRGLNELFDHLTFEKVLPVAETIMKRFSEGQFDKVELIYNQFKNAASQMISVEQFLPVAKPAQEKQEKQVSVDYIYEPSQEEIIKDLIPNALKTQLYKALRDSLASEHGARMTAMHKATDNAGEILRDLRLTYNKARQATITKEILEIVGGAEALKN